MQKRKTVLYILAAGFTIAVAGIVLFVWIFFHGMQQLQQTTRNLYERPFAWTQAAMQLKIDLYQIRSAMLYASVSHANRDEVKLLIKQVALLEQHIDQQIEIFQRNFHGDDEQIKLLRQGLAELHDIRSHTLTAMLAQQHDAAQALIEQQGNPKFTQIVAVAEYIAGYAIDSANLFVLESEQALAKQTLTGMTYAILLLTLFLVISLLMVSRLQALHLEVDKFAFTDFLTGIANRRSFINDLESEIRRVQRYGGSFSFAMVDIDHFKHINDTYGHSFGDRVLQNFCVQCVSALRTSDLVGRLGGEEFAILMPMTELHEAMQVIERLRADIDHSEMAENGQIVHYTASFGLMSVNHDNVHLGLSHIMKVADDALYAAKQRGRNRVFIATQD